MRRVPGTGNILSRGGRHTARLRINGCVRSLGTFSARDDAERVLSAACAQLAEQTHITEEGASLEDYMEKWLDRRELSGVRSVRTDRSRFRVHVRSSALGRTELSEITSSAVRAWLDTLSSKHAANSKKKRKLSRSVIKHCLDLLRVCFDAAVEDGRIPTNPAKTVKPPKQRDTGDDWTYLDLEEQHRVAANEALEEADRLRILFALYTGLRQSEQWNLELRDVKLNAANGAHIVVRYGSRGGPTKSNQIRRVPLLPSAQRVVRLWLKLLPTYAKRNPHSLLWPTSRGCRRQPCKNYDFHEHLRSAGIEFTRVNGRRPRWHDLRHTTAASLISGWWGRPWRLEEVKVFLGHTDIKTTQRYAHLAPSVVEDAARDTPGNVVVLRRSAVRDQSVIQDELTPRPVRESRRPPEPKVGSNPTGRAKT